MLRKSIWIIFLILHSCTVPNEARWTNSAEPHEKSNSKTIVFIHGMFMTPKSWSHWKTFFEHRGYRVFTPAWPLHSQIPATLRAKHPDSELGKLSLKDVIDSMEKFVAALPHKPILIGHSMGGLIVQALLQRNAGISGVAINSAPAKGVLTFKFSFIKSNWPVLNPFESEKIPASLSQDQFHYAFTNCIKKNLSDRIFLDFSVPESKLVGKGTLDSVAEISFSKKTKPLLFIAGGEDNIIPASLNYSNFEKYKNAPSITEFKLFPKRCHWTVGQEHWEDVAGYIDSWINSISR